ncbi:MAG: PQQ-binding-like beta-propeller repeat protein, partial [Thermoplasmata archaeon]|nr:PQQ-binding-like beta-propeller repeat protein [Thermoplasmata archaeon]
HTFMGSETLDMSGMGMSYIQYSTWGPRIGWSLAIISGSLMLASSALIVYSRKEFDAKSPIPFLKKRAKPIIMAIVSVLIVLALIFSYYNYMDLDGDGYVTKDDLFPNDPREWEDLDEDGIGDNFDNFFTGWPGYELEMHYKYDTHGSVTNDIAHRMYPRGGAASDGDRIYAPSGKLGTQIWTHGLYAWDADSSIIWGGKPYETGSPISTDIEYVNFGSDHDVTKAEPIVFFGCEDGKIHVIRDGFDADSRNYTPSGNDVWSYQLDGEISGKIDVLNYQDSEFNDKDYFVASTTNGTLYAFIGQTPELNPVTGLFNVTKPSLLWETHIADVSLTGPAISPDREHVYVGTVDGVLNGIDLLTGEPIPDWNNNTYQVTDEYWSTSPVVNDYQAIICAATSNGVIHAIWSNNGTAIKGWEGGLILENEAGLDGGNLTELEITPDGTIIVVGSDTGYVYSINIASKSTLFAFDTTIGGFETQCLTKPYYDSRYSRLLFVPAICLNDTPNDISDDFSVIYCLGSTSNDTVLWRLTLPGRMYTSPISYIFNEHIGSKADLILITNQLDENGEETIGTLYCFNTVAR